MADVRCSLDGADVQERRVTRDSCLCNGVSQWRAGAEPRRTQRCDEEYGVSGVQAARACSDSTAGAWRPECAHQLQEYLGAGVVKRGARVGTLCECARLTRSAPRSVASRKMSLSTPAAVTAGPAPGPVITSGCRW